MQLAREWDLRFENLMRTGSLGKWYSSVGNEAVTVAAAAALAPGDALATLHRDVGALLARFVDPEALFPEIFDGVSGIGDPARRREAEEYLYRLACQMLGKAEGFTQGFDRSYHFGRIDEARRQFHVGMISHLGAMVPVAAGLALALALRGQGGVALNFIGDGATSTGDFHEGLNMATVWKLPLVLVIENNRFAFSTPREEQYACRHLADRAPGYGIPGRVVDGNDPEAVYRAVQEAAERARRGEGPTLLEAEVGRLRGHAEGDGSIEVVPETELERYRGEDPVPAFERRLAAEGALSPEQAKALSAGLKSLLIGITDRARSAREPDPRAALPRRKVFAPLIAEQERPERPRLAAAAPSGRRAGEGGATYLEAISRALREEMRRDPAVLLLGQDIAEFGGAFKATAGLVEEFGKNRVRNTPIAESGAIGIAVGAALLGHRPVVEMQFADFISCGFNQVVNVAAKLHYRWEQSCPITIRCPCGAGAGGGPFHSQNPEAWFTHVPGLKVAAPAFPHDALGLLKAAIRDPNPVLFFEHKHLYRRIREPLPEGEVLVPLGRARIARPGAHLTAIAYGWMVHRALEAAELAAGEGIDVEVVDLRTLIPLDEETVFDSVRRTSKAVVIHEAPLTGGFGAEVAARIAAQVFEHLDGPVRRVAFPDVPVPFHKDLEAACLPGAETILAAFRELHRY